MIVGRNWLSGIICIWSGSIASIPPGWVLCDGTNGTPDLRFKFVIGAYAGFPPGTVGGSFTHDHVFTGDVHSHDLQDGNVILVGPPDGDFEHDTTSSIAQGTIEVGSNIPPYYALAYIMKV